MFAFGLVLASHARSILRFAPSNLLLHWLRQRRHLRLGGLAVLPGVGYLALGYALHSLITGGGPGWLHIFVIVCIWSGLKLIAFAPISGILLIGARIRESYKTRNA